MSLLNNEIYLSDIKNALSLYDFRDFNNKKVLVTGASGLIGSAVVDSLLTLKSQNLNVDVIAAGRNILALKERFGDDIKPLLYDATSKVEFPNELDYIIACAGIGSPELYVKMPVETMLSNIIGLNNLLDYCKNKSTRLLYVSSSEVYGKNNTSKSFEEVDYGYIDQDNIRNSYSEAKRAAEMLARSYASEYDANVVMVRPGHIYGPTASRKDHKISSEFAYKAAMGQNLEMHSSGLQKRSYCYCIDTAMAILLCTLKAEKGQAYNIGAKQYTSIREMVSFLAKAGNVNFYCKEATEEEKKQFALMDNSSLSIKKIEQLGYKDSISVENGLKHTVEIIKLEL